MTTIVHPAPQTSIPSPPVAAATTTGSAASTPSPATPQDALTSKQTFLQLLVAQIKNQDPLNPTDPTQFVGQLTSYSQLEQLININQGVQTLDTALAAASSGSSGSSSGSSGGSSGPITGGSSRDSGSTNPLQP